ncbi:MAG TPA: class I SAM-dependent methyltransferase [Rubrobacter sp.]|nr:class I SAM-dependent methyltransferase [Rubrobacter sp.]
MKRSDYDDYATEYATLVAWRERGGAGSDDLGIMPRLLDMLGDVSDRAVLDAGCGEGYLARILAAHDARVTGIDLSPPLIALAKAKDPVGRISYQVADLSAPLPELRACFDAVASYMVLNDVEDYRGFATTLAQVLKVGGRAVLAFNNPYAYVVRKRIGSSYFASGTTHPCGLAAAGIEVSFYHRTLGEYLDAFLAAGLKLTKLLDVDHPDIAAVRATDGPLPEGDELPRFMILAFAKV